MGPRREEGGRTEEDHLREEDGGGQVFGLAVYPLEIILLAAAEGDFLLESVRNGDVERTGQD